MKRAKGKPERIFAILCSVIMALTIFPLGSMGLSYAADNDPQAAAAQDNDEPVQGDDSAAKQEQAEPEKTDQGDESKPEAEPEKQDTQKQEADTDKPAAGDSDSKAEEQSADTGDAEKESPKAEPADEDEDSQDKNDLQEELVLAVTLDPDEFDKPIISEDIDSSNKLVVKTKAVKVNGQAADQSEINFSWVLKRNGITVADQTGEQAFIIEKALEAGDYELFVTVNGKSGSDYESAKSATTSVKFKVVYNIAFKDEMGLFAAPGALKTGTDGRITLPAKPEAKAAVYTQGNTDYYFVGWIDGDKTFRPGEESTFDSSVELTADWRQVYTVSFDTNGGEPGNIESMVVPVGEAVDLPEMTKAGGWSFLGWTTQPKAKNPVLYNNENKLNQKEPEDIELTAVYGDKTAPVVSFERTGTRGSEQLEGVYTINAVDQLSKIDSLEYCVTDSSEMPEEGWQKVKFESVQDAKTDAWSAEKSGITVEDGKFLQIRAIDNAKNAGNGLTRANVDENDKPELTLTYDADTDEYFDKIAKAHTFKFSATDNVAGDEAEFSGINMVTVKLIGEGGDEIELEPFTAGEDVDPFEPGEITIDKELAGTELTGAYTVQVQAVDNCGNESEVKELTMNFDSTVPEISEITMSDGTESDGKYYYNADNCGLTIKVTDSVELKSVKVKFNDSEVYTEEITGGSQEFEKTWTAEEMLQLVGEDCDEEISISVEVEDAAGNTNDKFDANNNTTAVTGLEKDENVAKCIIDAVAPKLVEVSTSAAGNRFEDLDYYEDNADTTFTVEESNLSEMTLTYKKNGTEAQGDVDLDAKTAKGSWTTSSKDEVAKYTDISLYAEDTAGNKLVLDDDCTYTNEESGSVTVSEGTASLTYGKVIDKTPIEAEVKYTTDIKSYVYGDTVFTRTEKVIADVKVSDNDQLPVDQLYRTDKDADSGEFTPDAGVAKLSKWYQGDIKEVNDSLSLGMDEGEYQLKLYGTDKCGRALVVKEIKGNNFVVKDGEWSEEGTECGTSSDLKTFVIDRTAPKYDAAFNPSECVTHVGALRSYYGEKVTAEFTIKDDNIDVKRFGVGSKCDESDPYSEADPGTPEITKHNGEVSGTTATYSVTTDMDGAWRFAVQGEDKAGNPLEMSTEEGEKEITDYNRTISGDETGLFQSLIKIVDTKAPTATMTIDDFYKLILDSNNEFDKDIFDPFRDEKKVTIKIKGKDKSPVYIKFNVESVGPKAAKKTDKVRDLIDEDRDKDGWDSATNQKYGDNKELKHSMTGEVQFEVKNIRIVDRAGNETSLERTNIIYLDGTKPKPGIDVVKPQAKITVVPAEKSITKRHPKGQNIYNKSVKLKLTVYDPNENKSSSGLKTVKYTVYVDGKKIESDSEELFEWKLEDSDKVLGKNKELVYKKEYTKELKCGGIYESNNIHVVLYVEDNTGNNDSAKKTLGIDSIGPKITVTFDNNSAQHEKYFKANRTATVSVKERNLGTKSKKIKIKTEVGVPDKWSYKKGGASSGNSDRWIKKLHYTKDGDYTLSIAGTDALGNKASVSYKGQTAPRDFVIDKTAPIIYVTFDNKNARNGKYYKANRTATIRIREHNFLAKEVKVAESNKGPRNTARGSLYNGKFSSSGDDRYNKIAYNRDGSYSFKVNYTDMAGNKAKEVVVREFVIDKTKPKVKIENVINEGIYGDVIRPKAVYEDDNFDRAGIKFTFTGARVANRSNLVPNFHANGSYGGEYAMSDFPRIRENDDIYTAYAEITDKAGNSERVRVTFSVNRFGSTYDYDNDQTTKALVGKNGRYYTNEKNSLVLREINVNQIKEYSAKLIRNDRSIKLEEGTDYTVGKHTTPQGVQYVYNFSDELVTDEGSYNIVVKSEDSAGNTNTNSAIRSEKDNKEVPLKFVYDTTAPSLGFQDIAYDNETLQITEKEKYPYHRASTLDMGIVPQDDYPMSAIEYTLLDRNGQKVEKKAVRIDGEEFGDVMRDIGYFEDELGSTSTYKTLRIAIWDAAGNTVSRDYKILVSTNLLIRWFNNTPLFITSILILLALIAGIIIFLKRRRDEEEEEEEKV